MESECLNSASTPEMSTSSSGISDRLPQLVTGTLPIGAKEQENGGLPDGVNLNHSKHELLSNRPFPEPFEDDGTLQLLRLSCEQPQVR